MFFNFFTNKNPVNASLKCTLKSYMRSRSAHQSDKVVVALARQGIHAQVPYSLRVGLSGCVEAEADLNMLVLEVTVYGLRAADNSALGLMLLEVFCQQAGIGVRVISSNDN